MSTPLQTCSKCERLRPPEGGVQAGPGRWMCASCWTAFFQRRFK